MTNVWIHGGSNQIAAFLIPKLLQKGYRVYVGSRAGRPAWVSDHERLVWMPHQTPPQEIELAVYLAPLNEIGSFIVSSAGLRRLIAVSSTSAETKDASDHPAEREVSRRLLEGEGQLQQQSKARSISWLILRPTLIYGAGLDVNLTRVARFIKRWKVFPYVGHAQGRRMPVHSEDLAELIADNLTDERCQGIYATPGGETLGYLQMISKVFESLGSRPRLIRIPDALIKPLIALMRLFPRWRDLNAAMFKRMDQDLVFDRNQAEQKLGFRPRGFSPDAQCWLRIDQRDAAD